MFEWFSIELRHLFIGREKDLSFFFCLVASAVLRLCVSSDGMQQFLLDSVNSTTKTLSSSQPLAVADRSHPLAYLCAVRAIPCTCAPSHSMLAQLCKGTNPMHTMRGAYTRPTKSIQTTNGGLCVYVNALGFKYEKKRDEWIDEKLRYIEMVRETIESIDRSRYIRSTAHRKSAWENNFDHFLDSGAKRFFLFFFSFHFKSRIFAV